MTLAFTTFVLFQFFNIFNARAEHGSAFNRQFFRNGKLWLALAAVVALQVVVVHWGPAQAIFDTVSLTLAGLGFVGGDCVEHPAGGRSAQAGCLAGVRRKAEPCRIGLKTRMAQRHLSARRWATPTR